MKACNCTLPYFNGPEACLNCPNYEYEGQSVTYPYQQWGPQTKLIKRVTKTIDKYDNEGRLIGREVITEEWEDVEREVWSPIHADPYPQPPWIVSSSETINLDGNGCFTAMAVN